MAKFIEEALAEVLGVKPGQIGDVEFKLYVPGQYYQSEMYPGEKGFIHGRQIASIMFECSTLLSLSDDFGSLNLFSREKTSNFPEIYTYHANLLYGPETQKIAQAVFTGLSVA